MTPVQKDGGLRCPIARERQRQRDRKPGPHGLTRDEARAFLAGKQCEICGKSATDTDHSHKTRKLRGPLCKGCNIGLGHVEKNDGEWLKNALAYLDRYR